MDVRFVLSIARIRRNDRGAVALITAIMAIVLFAIGALAIDWGNAFARKRATQTTADLAALAGVVDLPGNPTLACQDAVNYMLKNVPGTGALGGSPASACTATGIPGEVTFSNGNHRINVTVPTRTISTGLANVVGVGSIKVNAVAAADVRSPGALLPFFLPATCSSGQQVIKEGSNGNNTEPTPVMNNAGPNNQRPQFSSGLTPSTLPQSSLPATVTITGSRMTPLAQAVLIRGTSQIPLTNAGVTGNNPETLTATVPGGLAVGTWYLQVAAQNGNQPPIWSTDQTNGNNGAPTFVVTPPIITGCGQSSTGDFGLLDSPRKDVNQSSQQLDLNLALGEDHGLNCYPWVGSPCDNAGGNALPAPGAQCNHGQAVVLPGAILDNDATRDDANCMDIDNGNKVSFTTNGLITGGTDSGITFSGRLHNNLNTGCTPPTGGTNPFTMLGTSINNDTLSCYLTSGHTLTDVKNGVAGSLNAGVAQSPRFFLVPVLDVDVNPQNGFYPIKTFDAVFITDQSENSAATCSDSKNCNGIVTDNSTIKQITVFAFPLSALPPELGNTGQTSNYIGTGPKVPRLVQ